MLESRLHPTHSTSALVAITSINLYRLLWNRDGLCHRLRLRATKSCTWAEFSAATSKSYNSRGEIIQKTRERARRHLIRGSSVLKSTLPILTTVVWEEPRKLRSRKRRLTRPSSRRPLQPKMSTRLSTQLPSHLSRKMRYRRRIRWTICLRLRTMRIRVQVKACWLESRRPILNAIIATILNLAPKAAHVIRVNKRAGCHSISKVLSCQRIR